MLQGCCAAGPVIPCIAGVPLATAMHSFVCAHAISGSGQSIMVLGCEAALNSCFAGQEWGRTTHLWGWSGGGGHVLSG